MRVDVLLHSLPQDNAIVGFLGFLDCVGETLNSHQHRRGRFQSWWTHFSLLLKYGDGTTWLLERNDQENVVYHQIKNQEHSNHNNQKWTIVWHGQKSYKVVEGFINKQREDQYDFFGKNCQHFAYDFFRCCLDDPRAHGAFESFSELCQSHF